MFSLGGERVDLIELCSISAVLTNLWSRLGIAILLHLPTELAAYTHLCKDCPGRSMPTALLTEISPQTRRLPKDVGRPRFEYTIWPNALSKAQSRPPESKVRTSTGPSSPSLTVSRDSQSRRREKANHRTSTKPAAETEDTGFQRHWE